MTITQEQCRAALDYGTDFDCDDDTYLFDFWRTHGKTVVSALQAMADPMWQLVPKDGRQLKDCEPLVIDRSHGQRFLITEIEHIKLYNAMLSAAPAHAAPKEGG